MAKDRRSKDQRRKAKLTERSKKHAPLVEPYEGEKYRAEKWIPHVFETELAVYEAIGLSGRRLTNRQVKDAYTQLVLDLRAGVPPLLPAGEPDRAYAAGDEVAYLVWNVRRHWGVLFEERGPVAVTDLIGLLRSLLFSMEAQAWALGADRGYVVFLEDFMGQMLRDGPDDGDRW